MNKLLNANKIYLFISFNLLILFKVNGQDTIYLRNDSIIPAKIISADNRHVRIKKWNRENGPDYVYSKNELKRIKYSDNNKTEYYQYTTIETAIGISVFQDKYSTSPNLSGYDPYLSEELNKGLMINFLFRSNVLGFSVNAGYSYLTYTTQQFSHSYFPPYGYSYSYTTKFNTYIFLANLRFNLSRNIFNPFLFAGIGFDSSEDFELYSQNSGIYRIGCGLQFKVKEHWLLEAQAGFGKIALEYPNPFYGHLGINILRVISSHKYYAQ